MDLWHRPAPAHTIRPLEGSYDSFERSRAVIERLFALARPAVPDPAGEEWPRVRREAEALYAEDLRLITRDGELRGPSRIFDDFAVQSRHFEITLELGRMVAAPDGRVLAVTKITRRSREDPGEHLWALGAGVYGVREGRIAYFEGFPNVRRACEDAGVDPELIG